MTHDDELIQLTEAQTEQARYILQKHIDTLNKGFAETVARLEADSERFNIFQKRSTYIVWAMFWISGFLARGLFQGQSLASFAAGISAGVLIYWSVYGVIHLLMLRYRKEQR